MEIVVNTALNFGQFALLVGIFFKLGGIIVRVETHDKRLDKLEKKHV